MKLRLHYAWVVLGVTSVALLMSAGGRAILAVFIVPMEAEFGSERATISLAFSFGVLVGAFSQPLVGQLVDRYGLRKVVSILCVLIVGVGALASSSITAPWQLYLTYGLTAGLGGGTVATGVAARWFARNRSMAIAIGQMGTSLGQVVMAPLATALALAVGWRWGYALIGLALVAVVFPLVLWLMRDDPADMGLQPLGADAPGSPGQAARPSPASEVHLTPRQAFQTGTFWLLAGSFFVCGFTSGGLVGTHLVAWADDHHFPTMAAATTYGIMAIFNVPAALASGWVSDRYNKKNLLAAVYFTRGLALLYLLTVTDLVGLNTFAVIMGMSWFATVPPTAALTADLVGKRSAATVYGWVFLSHQVGNAIAAWLAGAIFDATGTYTGIFMAAGLMDFVAAALAFMIRERTRRRTPAVAAAAA